MRTAYGGAADWAGADVRRPKPGRRYGPRVPARVRYTLPDVPAEPPLIERDVERATLAAMLAAAADGRGGLVRVLGAPGTGVSRLLDTVADDARTRPAPARTTSGGGAFAVHHVGCSAYEQDVSLSVVRALLGSVTSARSPVGATDADPHRLVETIAAAADHRPLALIVDDLQWADPESVDRLAFLARRIDRMPVALMVGIRTGGEGGDRAWRALAGPSAGGVEVTARPLSRTGVLALNESMLGRPVDAAFVDACLRLAGGHPWCTVALLRSLAADDVAPDASAAEALPTRRSPRDLRDWMQRRVDAAGDDAVAVARAIAVLGDDAPTDRIGRVAVLGHAAVARAGDELRAVGVLRAARMAFEHPLARVAVHDAIPSGGRSQAHRQAAELVIGDVDGLGRAARHLREVFPAGDPWAVDVLVRAAEQAIEDGDVPAAIMAWRRALAEPAVGADRVTALAALGGTIAATGDPEGAELLETARAEATDPEVRARITLRLCQATMLHDDAAVIGRRLAGAIGDLGAEHGTVRLELEAFRAMLTHASLDLRQVLRPALLEIADREEAPPASAVEMHAALALEWAQDGPIDRALVSCSTLLDADDPANGLGGPASQVSIALNLCERYADARGAYDRTIAVARRVGSSVDLGEALAGRARIHLTLGDVAAAAEDARAAMAVLPTDTVSVADGCRFTMMAEVLLETDRVAEALTISDTLDALRASPFGETSLTRTLDAAVARVLLAAGQTERALERLRALAVWYAAWGTQTPSWPGHSDTLPLALRDAGHRDEARAAAADALQRARALGLRDATARALRVAGCVEGGDRGLELLTEAITVLGDSPARLEWIRVRIELGAALRRGGRRRAARDPLLAARDLAVRCGARALERRAHEELLASGARPRRTAVEGPNALTPSELRVARLAAAGMDNPTIARTLVLSRKTIEMHLSQAYRKLGVAGRGDLGAVIGRP